MDATFWVSDTADMNRPLSQGGHRPGRNARWLSYLASPRFDGGVNLMSRESLKKLGILGVSFGLIASPPAFGGGDEASSP